MTVAELLKCAKPLFFDTGDEEWSYAFGGSCFVASFGDAYYVVTARHCFENQNKWKPEQMRSGLASDSGEFLPSSFLIRLNRPGVLEADKFCDVVFFKIDTSLTTAAQLTALHPVDLAACARMKPINLEPGKTLLALKGYPTVLNQINYETRQLPTRSYSITGTYDGPAPFPKAHLMKFHDVSPVSDHDGLSGSPVFLFSNKPDQTTFEFRFAGLHVRGGKTDQHIGCFIDAQVIFSALRQSQAKGCNC